MEKRSNAGKTFRQYDLNLYSIQDGYKKEYLARVSCVEIE